MRAGILEEEVYNMMNILAWTGYWVGLGIELFVIVVAGTLLILMLTGVFDILWAAIVRLWERFLEWCKRKKEEREQKKAEKAARADAEAAARAEAEAAEAEKEAAAALAEEEAEGEESEAADSEEPAEEDDKSKKKKKKDKKGKKDEEEAEPSEETAENSDGEKAEENAEAEDKAEAEDEAKTSDEEEEDDKSKKKKKKGKKTDEEEESEGSDGGDGDGKGGDTIIIQEGVVFSESKTITELYEELSMEQKGFFDELREAALAKPDAELSMSKTFVAVKIGKRNLIKLLIKRGVTTAEFLIENEELKKLRLSNTNKRGKSTIKVKPTVVSVLDVASLQVAIDMINLSYEEIVLAD